MQLVFLRIPRIERDSKLSLETYLEYSVDRLSELGKNNIVVFLFEEKFDRSELT